MFIGIDLGTSSVKMILVDYEQNILATSNASLTVQTPKDGYSEQNPSEWIDATFECLEGLKSKKPKETFLLTKDNNERMLLFTFFSFDILKLLLISIISLNSSQLKFTL